jgi:integrase
MKKIGRPKVRRTRTDHRGVKLLSRRLGNGTVVHVARWADPVTGKPVQISLTKLLKRQGVGDNEESRESWAIDKSNSLSKLREDAAAGRTPPTTKTAIAKAVADYIEGLTRKAPKTVKLYTAALAHFTAWARKAPVVNIEDLTGAHLAKLSKYLHSLKAKASAKGERRGANKHSARLLAPASVNQFVRGIRTFLTQARREDLTPNLTGDLIRDRLPFAKRPQTLPHFLTAKEARALLEACQRHDKGTYKRHRWQEGVTYLPITPLVTAALLSGARFGELANLRWSDVDLDAGVITLDAIATKTGMGRRITLRETPALWALLERMKLQAGENPYVFGSAETNDAGKVSYHPLRRDKAEAARRRLQREFAAPVFDWHTCRRTAGTFLTCAGGIYGAASAFLSAKRLGHSVVVAEKHYAGAVNNIPLDVSTLEAAMGIADLLPTREQTPAEQVA